MDPTSTEHDPGEAVAEAPLRAQVDLTEADLAGAYVSWGERKGSIGATRKLTLTVAGVITVVVLLGWPPTWGLWIPLLVASIGGVFYAKGQLTWVARVVFSLLHPKRRSYELELGADGVSARGPKAQTRDRWGAFREWWETDGAFVLQRSNGSMNVIPKRALPDADVARARALLEASIEPPVAAPDDPAKVRKKANGVRTFVIWLLLMLVVVAIYQLVVEP